VESRKINPWLLLVVSIIVAVVVSRIVSAASNRRVEDR
jgi:preprotein translocase subunit Sec61beta